MRRSIIILIGVIAALFVSGSVAVAAPPTPSWVPDVLPNSGSECAVGAFLTNLGTAPGVGSIDLWYGTTQGSVLTGSPRSTFGPVRVNAGDGVGNIFTVPDGAYWRVRFTGTPLPGKPGTTFTNNRVGRINQPGCTT